MSLEVRTIRPDEAREFFFISAYSFNGARDTQSLDERARRWPVDRCLAAFEDGTMTAGLRIIKLTQRINGGPVGMGGIVAVVCLPEHRRKGHVGRLLNASLEKMRTEGQPLSGLGTPFPALYRGWGWEYANRGLRVSFSPKDVSVLLPAKSGSARRAGPDEWRTLDEVYRRYAADRNGYVERDESWWRDRVLCASFEGDPPRDAAVWEDPDGAPVGYMVYEYRQYAAPAEEQREEVLRVADFAALTPDAYSGLLQYLLNHDRATRIEMEAPPDTPLTSAVEQISEVRMTAFESQMLRVVDFKAAVAARPALPVADGASFTVRIVDEHAPWNDGIWRIEAAEGRVAVEKATGQPDLECDIRDFAPIYSSYRKPRDLALVGALKAHRPEALDAAEAVFAAAYPPWTQDWW